MPSSTPAAASGPSARPARPALLEVRSLTTAYRGLIAISDISIDVHPGEIVAVAGANGAGKSTLLKTVEPGHLITARGLAYVPENRRLFPRLSVADNLRLGSYLHRSEADREAPLEQVFSLFPRLKERLPQRAVTLSGGEQQMLAIGRALMTRPRLLMPDEPSQGIMPKLVDEIFQAVLAIRDTGVTVLIVEQRLAESLEIANRAYVLQTGRVVLSGTSAEVGSSPEIRRAYLGM
jgi:branched-chain amino acid transport system ATP-binding protein